MRSFFHVQLSGDHIVLPTLLQGIPKALFFAPLTITASPLSRAYWAAASAHRWRASCGTTARSCITPSWPGNPAQAARSGYHSLLNTAQTQAAMPVLDDVFHCAAIVTITIIPLIWITKPDKPGDTTVIAH
ncbi:hypothetical protein QCE63_24170 [Caballeronia sp. LZ065]|uniref:hypothetical protein n=1 Tax=Caballeronia sp. LZ065 TaxID=3038571 RepID=UPI00285ECCB8|nr:hypothetical protein [Caballeronia sp. LZ065]MDR5782503.1 hypothetical protein [Caballeronia sp. LZ065]